MLLMIEKHSIKHFFFGITLFAMLFDFLYLSFHTKEKCSFHGLYIQTSTTLFIRVYLDFFKREKQCLAGRVVGGCWKEAVPPSAGTWSGNDPVHILKSGGEAMILSIFWSEGGGSWRFWWHVISRFSRKGWEMISRTITKQMTQNPK